MKESISVLSEVIRGSLRDTKFYRTGLQEIVTSNIAGDLDESKVAQKDVKE